MSLFRVLVQVIMAISMVRPAFLCYFCVAWKRRYALEGSAWDVNTLEKKKVLAGCDEQPFSER